jgi:hypothetical protein
MAGQMIYIMGKDLAGDQSIRMSEDDYMNIKVKSTRFTMVMDLANQDLAMPF